ncbi:uL13 family ribosomal protein [Anabaena cylindrica FACHB-243]|uniref:Phage integrase n=1 Tax=Anabaena cylindrica (strain ATCC 27899 / PCC 7122) TaxID=272123 RepID=K9ZCE9_ANACC|nr:MULTISPECIES: uL13 family ribosomal protein [Anabaena]AFZ56898.1 phage integrase [Anabaena cylindrica PCC 7122]MBD2418431.1 uL13 family ribosomal protein [Anabaena cylindrica FACHB-243]MBY5284886.1 site-specific integrase [Anabaena sp. CCAP 1446/1C]MBY5307654.1 site-specific integrase [Anabaena sp. CCAP 1446/1C]MCM2409384.1 uL13 family ribosomal protein [Anabaena sp. CCAP 1446/1C]
MIDQRIKEANGRLKNNYCGVRIEQISKKLYIRGIFPPKSTSDKFEPHQQRISISSANSEGLKLAEKLAKKISIQLDAGTFNWADWVEVPNSPSNIGDWIIEFEKHYIQNKGDDLSARDTWRTEYVQVLKHLPLDEILSREIIKKIILRTLPNTRTRKRYCQSLKVFCDFVGLDFDFKSYRGNYSSSKRKPRTLPDDQLIEEWYSKINNPSWRWTYGMLAAYGLRGHEVFFLNLDGLKSGLFYIEVLQGKTGYRLVYPFRLDWVEKFKLADDILPEINCDRSHAAIGNTVTQYFRRAGLPFKPYDLRHAWAVRTLNLGLDISLAAQQMGHSLKIHSEIYHTWISARVHRDAFNKILSQNS